MDSSPSATETGRRNRRRTVEIESSAESTSSGKPKQELEAQKGLLPFPSENFGFYFNSTKEASEELLEALQDDSCTVIGLYGMKGSGKTALIRAELNKYRSIFRNVVFPNFSKNQDISSIQDEIAKKVKGVHFERDDSRFIRSHKIASRLTNMSGATLVILDDFPTICDPREVGIPYGRNGRYKLLITTLNEARCISLGCDSLIPLKPLSEDESWVLLQKLSGVSIKSGLFNVAKEVAFKCRLPSLVKDVVSSLKNKPVMAWEESLVSLSHSTARYQIFISFRGSDTREDFAMPLYEALCSKGFKTFIDDESIEGWTPIKNLLNYIEESRFAIIILSKNYAESEWCLKELVKILKCEDSKRKDQLVLPIFYEVEPKAVRHVQKSYADAMAKHKNNSAVNKWKKALFDVCTLQGFEKPLNYSRDELIRKVVNFADDHRHRLHIQSMYMGLPRSSSEESTPSQAQNDDSFQSSSSRNFMYLGSTNQAQNSLKETLLHDECLSIGLFGKRGSGKTALVKAEIPKYQKIFCPVLFVTVSEKADIGNLQNQIALQLNLNFQEVTSQNERASVIKSYLLNNKDKVLVIFDDVSTNFNPQDIGIPIPTKHCKILLISHDKKYCNMIKCRPSIHLRPLSNTDASKLLQQYSGIDRDDSPPDLFNVAHEVAILCKGLPRVIEDVVSSLHDKSIENWTETLDCLRHSAANHQIFISFRGKDTRGDFTASLFDALVQGGFKVFKDNIHLRIGDQVSEALIKAIEQSRCSIVVLSENYAESSWCLDELVKILKCREEMKQLVLPIFYKVDPSAIRYLKESFGKAITKNKKRFEDDKIQEWTLALFQVAGLSGRDYKTGSQIALIEEIVQYARDNKHRLHIV